MKLTPSDIVQAIGKLSTKRSYNYIEKKTTTKIQIVSVTRPEGPIQLKRWNPNKKQGIDSAKNVNISTNMLRRVANAAQPGQVLNIDRVVGGSYNTRSALETLLAHTPEFYICYPGRIEISTSTTAIKRGHKHLLWLPNDPHEPEVIVGHETDVVISELPSVQSIYESLSLPEVKGDEQNAPDIEFARRHAQIQVRLVMIGCQLGYRTWVARNDRGIIYNNKRIGEMRGVVADLNRETLISPYADAVRAAMHIDCVWFRNAKFMPAVIEIEHTTGVTSGLARMKNLQDALPLFRTRWVIAAPDESRDKVMQETAKPMFQPLNARFLPYSAIEELYDLCERRHLTPQSVNEEFLESFMEQCSKQAA